MAIEKTTKQADIRRLVRHRYLRTSYFEFRSEFGFEGYENNLRFFTRFISLFSKTLKIEKGSNLKSLTQELCRFLRSGHVWRILKQP